MQTKVKENKQIEILKQKAKSEKKDIKPITSKYHFYNAKTRKMELRERVIRSGKEGNSLKRIFLIIAFIGIELVFLGLLYTIFLQAFLWFLFIPYGVGVVFACRVAVSGKNSDSKIAWILFLLLLAPVAFIVYILAGEMTASPLKSRKLKKIVERTKLLEKKQFPDNLSLRIRQDCAYIQNTSDYIPYFSGDAEYFPMGDDFFEDVLDRLTRAEKFIFMDFFILEEGYLANAVFEILAAKAKAGVDVRVITDGLGSHGTLSLSKVRRIRKCGIKIIAFEPVLPIVSFFINYRNHRKIIVIDGHTGYVGGTNMADEYINIKNRYGVWKDASMRIEGESVKSLTLTFLRIWEYSSKKKTDYSLVTDSQAYVNSNEQILTAFESEGGGGEGGHYIETGSILRNTNESLPEVIIPYADGPNEKNKLGKGVYANIIGNASKTLYIMTPYFIIDNYLVDLLKAKAQSGVDVRLIIPGIPDKKMVYSLTRYNAEKLISSGVRVYVYSPGFLHSKVMLSDNECAVVGSINMDFRSFYQQYESAAYISKSKALSQIENDFNNTFQESLEITLDNIKKRNIFKRIALAFLRLFSPLM